VSADRLRVLVVGAGSIGRRHIANLLTLGADVLAVRQRAELADELAREFGIATFASLDAALATRPAAAVIGNRTDQHVEAALAAARAGCHLYIEKPVAASRAGLTDLEAEVERRGLVVEVGCMWRFHPGLRTVKQLLDDGAIGPVRSAHVFVGQHLVDWRPGRDYRESYSARRAHGGGVLLDLVHELDYLTWLLGRPREVFAFLEHLSDLETDVEDTAELLLRLESGALAHVHLDCVRPVYGRGLELVGADGVLGWDAVRGRVIWERRRPHGRRVFRLARAFERNSMFVESMKHFLARIAHGGLPAVSLAEAVDVLEIVLAARASADAGRVMPVARPVTAGRP
jgi:predicted dehydrogenase